MFAAFVSLQLANCIGREKASGFGQSIAARQLDYS